MVQRVHRGGKGRLAGEVDIAAPIAVALGISSERPEILLFPQIVRLLPGEIADTQGRFQKRMRSRLRSVR